MPKYSVLMSLYKNEKPEYLKLAIDSMLNQTVRPDEVVIVKDGLLTDALEQVLDSYSESNLFKIIGYEENNGLGFALNFGLMHCKNELVARMDTDDISKPERCEKEIQAFEEDGGLCIVGSSIDEFYGNMDNIISSRIVPESYEQIYKFAKRRSAFNHPTVMYKKSKVLDFGGYANLRRNQDVDLFGRMLFGGCKARNIQESLLYFRSDEALAKRRKSWENTWSYILTIKRFWEMGYSSFYDFAIVTIAQIGMFICPIKIQNFIYKNFLRNQS